MCSLLNINFVTFYMFMYCFGYSRVERKKYQIVFYSYGFCVILYLT
jgi:hypothetical protein